jgi:hypothetical protein
MHIYIYIYIYIHTHIPTYIHTQDQNIDWSELIPHMHTLQEFLLSDALLADNKSMDTEAINTLEHVVDLFATAFHDKKQTEMGASGLDFVPIDIENCAFTDMVRVCMYVCITCVCMFMSLS